MIRTLLILLMLSIPAYGSSPSEFYPKVKPDVDKFAAYQARLKDRRTKAIKLRRSRNRYLRAKPMFKGCQSSRSYLKEIPSRHYRDLYLPNSR